MANHKGFTGKEGGRRWLILGVLYLCALAFAVALQSVPPILSLVMSELKLSHAEGGLLMSFFALPGIIVSIPAGMLADRYNQKVIGIVSLALIAAGAAIFATGSSLPVLALGRVVSGAGAITIAVLTLQLLAQWFAGYEMGIAMGIFSTGMPMGTILSMTLSSLLGENMGWRATSWLNAGLSLAILVIFAALYTSAPQRSRQASPSSEDIFPAIRRAGVSVWLIGAAWMLFNAAFISFYTFTPDLLTTTGFSISSAGLITSSVMWPAFVLGPVIGYVIDRIDRKRAIIVGCGLASATLMMWIPRATDWALVLILFIGIPANLMPPPIFALTSEVSSPERLGLGYGIISTCLNVGVLVGPAVAGLIRDVTGSYHASYAVMSAFAIAIMLVMLILIRRGSEKPHS